MDENDDEKIIIIIIIRTFVTRAVSANLLNLRRRVKLGTLHPCPRPVNTGVIFDTRVHGPCSRVASTAREHGRVHGP